MYSQAWMTTGTDDSNSSNRPWDMGRWADERKKTKEHQAVPWYMNL